MKYKQWTDEERTWLKLNRDRYTIRQCSDALGRTKGEIDGECRRLSVLKNIPFRYPRLKDSLCQLNSPEIVYLLGLIWADGHVENNPNAYKISFTLLKTDFDNISDALVRTGEWIVKSYTPKCKSRNNKEISKAYVCSKEICRFFVENDYEIKSTVSPDKILSKIPENLRHYWWRGYFDGDGWMGKDRLSITSSKTQDWSFVHKLGDMLKIKFRVCVHLNGNGGYSMVVLSNKKDRMKFCEYIYLNWDERSVGLKRKRDAFLQSACYVAPRIAAKTSKFANIGFYEYFGDLKYRVLIKRKEGYFAKRFKTEKEAVSARDEWYTDNGIEIPVSIV